MKLPVTHKEYTAAVRDSVLLWSLTFKGKQTDAYQHVDGTFYKVHLTVNEHGMYTVFSSSEYLVK